METIVAIATGPTAGAISVIRLSGDDAITICNSCFKEKNLTKQKSHTIHFGKIMDGDIVIDEVLVSLFIAPNSYTREDVIEVSCHGSTYIQQKIIDLFLKKGARLAKPGEFTMRAFLNGQMDLAQAEAVADLIAASTKHQHEIAINQMRGGFTSILNTLREKLIEFASLIELENDFGEEDVEFADRTALIKLIKQIQTVISDLKQSFQYGNAIKEGIPVAIVGKPNVGKSTLLNVLLNEEKAIISDIPGTTRDIIEDTIQIEGLLFRFIDTAGIRATTDTIESIGINKAKEQLSKAKIVIYIDEINENIEEIIENYKQMAINNSQKSIILLNKSDAFHQCHQYDIEEAVSTKLNRTPTLAISAKEKTNIDRLLDFLVNVVEVNKPSENNLVVSNIRHVDALEKTDAALNSTLNGLANNTSSDLVAVDIRQALHFLGEITGTITTEDLLDSIFGNFCIGK